jgi:hypothetical protein
MGEERNLRRWKKGGQWGGEGRKKKGHRGDTGNVGKESKVAASYAGIEIRRTNVRTSSMFCTLATARHPVATDGCDGP